MSRGDDPPEDWPEPPAHPMVDQTALSPTMAYAVTLAGGAHVGVLLGSRVRWDESRGWLGQVVFAGDTWVECNLTNLTMEGQQP